LFRFLHAADLHLDSPLWGLERYEGAPVDTIRQASRKALTNLVNLAIAEQVRFVLIAGDVYDGDWLDVNTGLYFIREMARLRDHGVEVFVISGNHDAANKMTQRLPYPDNVRTLPTDQPGTIRLEEMRVAIHGQGYAEQRQTGNLAVAYPEAVPGYLNIGLLHTALNGRPGHDHYAPCQVDELLARHYDYWALGHVHQRESVVKNRVEFPGNVQGRHVEERGAKGCLVVHVDDNRNIATQFHPLDVFRWERAEIECGDVSGREDIAQRAGSAFDDLLAASGGRPLGVRVELTGSCPLHDQLLAEERQLRADVLATALSRGADKIWVEKVQVRTSRPSVNGNELALDEDAVSEMAAVIAELREQPGDLQALLDAGDIKHLAGRLPPAMADMRLADAGWACGLLDRVQALLTRAGANKDAAP
jgi:DNA repair exonuclease SbcCD nuclease subunit